MHQIKRGSFIALGISALVAGCAMGPDLAEVRQATEAYVVKGFKDNGQAKVARITQTDETNRLCSEADASGKPLDEASAKRIEQAKWPANGHYIGDWKKGEAIAQSGRGMTWTDAANAVNGGNCYNCHQISQEEISHGTIGPSLYNYGKNRGVSDPYDPKSAAIVQYTWGKIWNPKAYNACSNMPRGGHNGVINEDQVRDIMALLLDPKSPVNK
jgi:sulfur-oxidizing protein SoxX